MPKRQLGKIKSSFSRKKARDFWQERKELNQKEHKEKLKEFLEFLNYYCSYKEIQITGEFCLKKLAERIEEERFKD